MMQSDRERSTKTEFDTTKPDGELHYYQALEVRKVTKGSIQISIQRFSEFCAKRNILAMVAAAVGIGIFLGFVTTCNVRQYYSKCTTNIIDEVRIPLPYDEQDPAKDLSEIDEETIKNEQKKPEKNRTETTIIKEGYFNYAVFRGWLFLAVFILAFLRWQVGNTQTAMSEMFERKQKANLLILEKQSDVGDLISGAMNLEIKHDKTKQKDEFSFKDSDCLIADFERVNPHGDKQPNLVQKMFVYIELDNMEFAYTKYQAGLLDAEQMYRACEIFESRCQSKLFRHIAAQQGLSYYADKFQYVIRALLIFGFAESNENYK